MKRRLFVQYLLSQGCRIHREGGKHTVFYNPVGNKVSTVPRHQEINDFLVKKVCRDLGIVPP
ncbi:MAG: type II toxin-antitoxin system HicA family toxin [Chloroflexota bacterium]